MADPSVFASSAFTSDAEGWQVQVGYPNPQSTKAAVWARKPRGFTTHAIVWSTAMGADDPPDSDPPTEVFFLAPTPYTGDLSSCYGFPFDFELILEVGFGQNPDGMYSGAQGLILESSAGDLWIPAAVQDTVDDPELGPVQRVSVLVKETADCRLSTTGAAPTQAEFKASLASITGVLVRIAWYNVAVWKSAIGAVAIYQDATGRLDPKLEALRGRITSAIQNDALTLDATVLGADGAGIADLIRQEFGVTSLSMSGSVAATPDGDALALTADSLDEQVAGASGAAVLAIFGVAPEGLTTLMTLDCGTGWTIGQTFPQLGDSWAGTVAFISETDQDETLILSSEDRAEEPGRSLPAVARGLNLSGKVDVADGAAKALTTLVTGVSGPLPVLGPIQAAGDTEQYSLKGSLPDFSVTVPILPALHFNSPYVQLLGLWGGSGPAPLYYAAVLAGADVTVGTSSLPLAMQIPATVGEGWELGLAPGQAVGVGQVASFLGEFAGVSLGTALPDPVKALDTLQLNGFWLQLTSDLTDYQSLRLAFGTTPGSEGRSVWTIIPGSGQTPILALQDIGVDLQAYKSPSGTRMTGKIRGVFAFGTSVTLQAIVPIPVGSSPFAISVSTSRPLPNLQDFAHYIGGRQLSDLLPRNLGAMTSYVLDDLTFVYDPSANTFTSFALSLSAAEPWVLITDQLSVENAALQLQIDDPMGGNIAPVGRVSGTIAIGQTVAIDVEVSRSDPTAHWLLSVFTEEVPLPSLGDIAKLMGGDVAALLPQTLRDNHFTLRDVELGVDITAGTPEEFSFTLDTQDTWPIITDILSVTEAGVYLNLDWSGGQRVATGRIFGNVEFVQAAFWLEAEKKETGWTLTAHLMEGEQLTAEHLADAFVAGLWSQISALGVPNLALTSADATYDTATSEYSLSAEVGPASGDTWTVPVGISSISIESLGATVTCERNSDGTAKEKKVYVTGAFSIGTSVHFNVKYLAGENLTIDCTLVGSDPVSVLDLINDLCEPGASSVQWTSAFEALDDIHISDVSAQIVLGNDPSFLLTGKMTVGQTEVDGLFIVKKISEEWEFALGIRITQDFTLGGFDPILEAFHIDKATWILAASSFDATNFTFPPTFPTPAIAKIEKGLDFYGTFSLDNTLDTIHAVTTVLPEGTITGTELTVHGLLTDPLEKSYLEVILQASEEGAPLMGWDAVRLAEFALRLTAEPAFALHGDFILTKISNPDGSTLHVILDLEISMTEVRIVFERQPGQGAIFTWQDAFGISALAISLTDLALGIIFEGPLFDGTIGGCVTFEHTSDPPNSVLKGVLPNHHTVALMEAKRAARSELDTPCECGSLQNDYARAYDPHGIEISMKISFMIPAEEPVPVPYELAGCFINFTLPYILKRFADITIPDILMPIQFPQVAFDFKLPNPLQGGSGQDLQFSFDGDIIIFGLHGSIAAEFDESRIMFTANMDPVVFEVEDTTILAITKSETDHTNGPDILVDSKPNPGKPNIAGDFYCDFFDFVEFGGSVELKIDSGNPADSIFHFTFEGHVGELADLSLDLAYEAARYIKVAGTFNLNLTTGNIPGFSKDGTKIASSIDLAKYDDGAGITLSATIDIELDDRNPADPKFSMHLEAGASLVLGSTCHPSLHLSFDLPVDKDSMSGIPTAVVSQMATNGAAIFGALIETAECFIDLVKLGLFVLEEAAEVSTVLVGIFAVGLDQGAKFLGHLGHTAEKVVHSLWHIFGSHDNKKNTSAMKGAGYSSDQTADAVKKVSDQAGHPYTAQDLVHDQATAGYSAPQVAGGLNAAFADYRGNPSGAGRLLADSSLTSFTPIQVADALRTQYASATATADTMATLLVGIYQGGASLTAQQMADALAPLYPAKDVAPVLRNHFPAATAAAAQMANLLLPAYQGAGRPLAVGDLADALAPLYGATDVAPELHTKFGPETNTAVKLAPILRTAYAGTHTPLDAEGMAKALATVFPTASDISPVLKQLYAPATTTAIDMGGLLRQAYPSLDVGGMAAALVAADYPAQEIGEALEHFYSTEAGTPTQMAALLAAQHYTPEKVAPVLKAIFPDTAGTATEMTAALQQGFGAGTIDAPTMASALSKAPFTPVEIAPALHSAYAAETATASQMATLLIDAFEDPEHQNTITADTMAQALAAAAYPAGDADGAAAALIANYASDTTTALDLSKMLQQAPYTAADVAPVLVSHYGDEVGTANTLAAVLAQTPFEAEDTAPATHTAYPTETATAEAMYGVLTSAYTDPALSVATMASALASTPYDAAAVSPVLKTHYPNNTATAEAMYGLLSGAFANPALGAGAMAGALAAAPYGAPSVAPLLKAHYPSDASTAAQVAGLLNDAYTTPAIPLEEMLAALAATSFGAFEMAPAVKPLYTPAPTAEALATELGTALTSTAPPSAIQLGVALVSAAYPAAAAAAGVKAALPDTSAGLMAAVLLLNGNADLAPALVHAESRKQAGDDAPTAAPKVVAAVHGLTADVLATALNSVFSPPNLAAEPLARAAVAGGYAASNAGDIATGVLLARPDTTAEGLFSLVKETVASIDTAQAAAAVEAAFKFIGSAISQDDFAKMIVSGGGGDASPDAVASALVTAYGNDATVTSVIGALLAGFSGSAVLVDARVAAVAVQKSFSLGETQADEVLEPLAKAFTLTECPNDVGALTVASKTATFSLNATSAALQSYFGEKWSARAFEIVGSVYSKPEWGTAVAERSAGHAINVAAPAIYAVASCDAALMVQVLAAVYDLTKTEDAIPPMASGLKAVVNREGAKVYTLNEASAAMSAHYSPEWTPQDYMAFVRAYGGGTGPAEGTPNDTEKG